MAIVRGLMWVICLFASTRAFGQTAVLRVEVRSEDAAVESADVIVGGATSKTDADGNVLISVSAGAVEVTVVKEGFQPITTSVTVAPGQTQSVIVQLTRQLEEHVTVSATRTDKRLEDVPMRVEVLGEEEIAEHVAMTPGDIVMMLNEMGGLRVQATSPSIGAAAVRIQGMEGRYTRVLSDGLPLFGAQVGGLGLLQIPPTDLAQVEVIKGVASALYGAGAMGGVINLISRRPTDALAADMLVNRSSRGATDAVTFLSGPLGHHWGATLLGGGHWQERNDIDGDGWADMAEYRRGELRPRFFWDNHAGDSFFVTAGATWEQRVGGTMPNSVLTTTGLPYVESLDTGRWDVGGGGQARLSNGWLIAARASATWQTHDHRFGDVRERDHHNMGFGEVSVRRTYQHNTVVAGAAVERDVFDSLDVPQFSYNFVTPGVFAQDDIDLASWLSVSASGRLDHHNVYGTFFSPRVSALMRAGRWSTRASVGTGFFPATPLTEETEAAGLSRLIVRGPLRAETGQGASLDVTRTDGPLSYTATVFTSRVKNPVWVNRVTEYSLQNLTQPTTNVGTELLATWRRAPFSITANYLYVRSRQFEAEGYADVPLTPRHAGGLVAVWERENVSRIGAEWYYTGRQRLEANPFRDESESYRLVGVLAERVIGHIRIFVNGENLMNVRQTQFDPLVRPDRGVDGRWTVDAWSPLDGRNINGGIRMKF
jgi:iron complex outermembrane receptor protein